MTTQKVLNIFDRGIGGIIEIFHPQLTSNWKASGAMTFDLDMRAIGWEQACGLAAVMKPNADLATRVVNTR